MPDEITFRLVGTAPLLMRSGRLADPLDDYAVALARVTSKRAKTPSDHRAAARLEWLGGLWLADGRPCIPAEALEAALVAGAKARRAGTVFRAAVAVRDSLTLEHDGPADLEELYADRRFALRCGVRVNNRTVVRTRPRFPLWSATATVSYLPDMVDLATLRDVARLAGDMVGIGDWRPRFGRFRVESAG